MTNEVTLLLESCTALSVSLFQFGSTWTMAMSLSQSLAQNLGIQWDPVIRRSKSVSPPGVKLLHFLFVHCMSLGFKANSQTFSLTLVFSQRSAAAWIHGWDV